MTSWLTKKYLLISNGRLLFILTKCTSESKTCLFKRWNNQTFFSKAGISSHWNYGNSHLLQKTKSKIVDKMPLKLNL